MNVSFRGKHYATMPAMPNIIPPIRALAKLTSSLTIANSDGAPTSLEYDKMIQND